MSPEDKAFFESCDKFKDYSSIDEYKADIRRYLTLSSWHYSEKDAEELMEIPARKKWVEESFAEKEPAADIAVDVGYCCG